MEPTGGQKGRSSQLAARLLYAAAPPAFAALVYRGITGNYFYADDFLNLYQIRNLHVVEYLLTPHGGHVLFTRNLVFYAMASFFCTTAELYFWTVLVTHLLNVALLFRLLVLLTGSPRLACLGASLWGISPLHQQTLGWYSVYGHVLAATFVLLILCQAARLATREQVPSGFRILFWYGLALAASTSFGTGTAVSMVLPAALYLILPMRRARLWKRAVVLSLMLAVPLLYQSLLHAYEVIADVSLPPGSLGAYLKMYWRLILAGTYNLASFGFSSLLLGFLAPDRPFSAFAYTVLLLFAAALGTALWQSVPSRRRQLAAFVLLAGACYGVLATGRLMFALATPSPVLTRVARYHYLGLALLAVLLGLVAHHFARAVPLSSRLRSGLLAVWFLVGLAAYRDLGPAIQHHDKAREGTKRGLAMLRRLIQDAPPGEAVYIDNRSFPGMTSLAVPVVSFPGLAAAFTIFFPEDTVDGRRVYFVERSPRVFEATRRGRRTRMLVVPERPSETPETPQFL